MRLLLRSTALLALVLLLAAPHALLAQSPSPSTSPAASPGTLPLQPLAAEQTRAFVPVLRFWSQVRDISADEMRAAVEGRSKMYKRVLVAAEEPAALWETLGVTPGESVSVGSVDEVREAVEASRRVLGLVPAGMVGPELRALSVDGVGLFGRGRLDDLADWPLTAPGPSDFDPAATWTLAAGGDVMLDREVYRKSVIQKKGPDYPWNGGFARITSRVCCTKDGGSAISPRTNVAIFSRSAAESENCGICSRSL